MKILIVASYLPYPLHNGGHVRLYNLMKELAKKHKLTLVCEKRSHQSEEDIKEVEKLCEEVICVNRRKQWSFQNVAKTAISSYPFLMTGHALPEMKNHIVQLLQDKVFDLIHVETFYVMQNLPKTYLPVVLVEHNVEYEVYRKYVATSPLPLRPLLLADIEKIKYWEKKFWKKATKLVAVSENDAKEMKRTDTVVVPNGVSLDSFPFVSSAKKIEKKEKRILFLGDFKWIQNREAVNWILDDIWPRIQQKMHDKNLKLWIVGKHIPENIKSQQSDLVIIDENAPDETTKIYQKSFALLAPITVGGGTSYKILESMASGVPVVTTTLGVHGLGAIANKDALVGQRAEELAEHVVTLFSDEKKYKIIQENARQLIEEKYTWPRITEILENVYTSAMTI